MSLHTSLINGFLFWAIYVKLISFLLSCKVQETKKKSYIHVFNKFMTHFKNKIKTHGHSPKKVVVQILEKKKSMNNFGTILYRNTII